MRRQYVLVVWISRPYLVMSQHRRECQRRIFGSCETVYRGCSWKLESKKSQHREVFVRQTTLEFKAEVRHGGCRLGVDLRVCCGKGAPIKYLKLQYIINLLTYQVPVGGNLFWISFPLSDVCKVFVKALLEPNIKGQLLVVSFMTVVHGR